MPRFVIAVAAILATGVAGNPASAAWYLALGDYQISGTAVGPSAAGVTLKFEDDGPGAVKVTLSNDTTNSPALLVRIDRVVFNLKDAFFKPNGTPLVNVSYVSGKKAEDVDISKDSKQIGVDPERYFDIGFEYSDSLGPASIPA